jgi:DNA gyrase subunit B
LNAYGRKNNLIKESEDNFTGEDVLGRFDCSYFRKIREIQFEGQTKASLGTVEARGMVESVLARHLSIS